MLVICLIIVVIVGHVIEYGDPLYFSVVSIYRQSFAHIECCDMLSIDAATNSDQSCFKFACQVFIQVPFSDRWT